LPIREYSCKKCGNIFEDLEIDVKTGKVKCTNCKSTDIVRRLSIFTSSRSSKSSCDITRRYT
jgi:putative FmdB family regulatory protein